MKTDVIDNSRDVIDSREVIERIEELRAELAVLEALAEEGANYAPDWNDGATLIRDGYFVEYAQEVAEDTGIYAGAGWPNNCIDWEYAARELRYDYSAIEFDGETYWVRS